MVDAGDSKSPALTGVPVRVRPWVPTNLMAYAVSFVLRFFQFFYSHMALILSCCALFKAGFDPNQALYFLFNCSEKPLQKVPFEALMGPFSD